MCTPSTRSTTVVRSSSRDDVPTMIAKFAGLDDVAHVDVVERERRRRDRRSRRSSIRRARSHTFANPLSSFTGRVTELTTIADVHLHHFGAGALAGVRHVHANASSIRRAKSPRGRGERSTARTSCSSARSRTRRAARRRRTDSRAAPTACGCRTPGRCPTDRGTVIGSLPPGLMSPNSISATALSVLLPEIPAFENRRHFLGEMHDRKRPAVEQQRDDRLSRGDHRVDELVLAAEQLEARAVAHVAAGSTLRATSARCRRSPARSRRRCFATSHRFGDLPAILVGIARDDFVGVPRTAARDLAAFAVEDLRVVADEIADALEHA